MKVRQVAGHEPGGIASSHESFLVEGAKWPEDLNGFLREMDRLYYRWIPRFTGGCVQMFPEPDGGTEAKVIPIGPVGLRLGPARAIVDRERGRIERPVLSGWLVGAASGTLAQELVRHPQGVECAVDLRSFRPRLLSLPGGAALYDRTQSVIHQRLSRAYLRHDVAPRLRSPS